MRYGHIGACVTLIVLSLVGVKGASLKQERLVGQPCKASRLCQQARKQGQSLRGGTASMTRGNASVDCAKTVSPRDAAPFRSPQVVHSLIAQHIAGRELVEIGTRNGDGMACFALHAKRATAVEYAPEYCATLRTRSAAMEAEHAGSFGVSCSDYRMVSLDADVVTWWEQRPLLNLDALKHLWREQQAGRLRPSAEAVLLFDAKWFLDRKSWIAICPIAAWSKHVEFNEISLCLQQRAAGKGARDASESCSRAAGHLIVAGIPVRRVPLIEQFDQAAGEACVTAHAMAAPGRVLLAKPRMWHHDGHTTSLRATPLKRVALCLYGVIGRSMMMTWPLTKKRIVKPLQAANLTVDVLGFDVDVGNTLVDGTHVDSALSVKVTRFDMLHSIPQADVDAQIWRLCGGVLGCSNPRTGKQRCPPLAFPFSTTQEVRKRGWLYGLSYLLNAYRQMHTELRIANFLAQPAFASRYAATIVMTADVAVLRHVSLPDVLRAAQEPHTLYTVNQNDRSGFTDGLLIGHPLPVTHVLSRLSAVTSGDLWLGPDGREYTDYEGLLKYSFEHHNLTRRTTCLPFVKVRANGRLAYYGCLTSNQEAWVERCSPKARPSHWHETSAMIARGVCSTVAPSPFSKLPSRPLPHASQQPYEVRGFLQDYEGIYAQWQTGKIAHGAAAQRHAFLKAYGSCENILSRGGRKYECG